MDSLASFPWAARAHHMGELKRADERWEVYLEQQADPDGRPVRGRLHFVNGERHRQSAWIFLEWTEREMRERFVEFSAVELWKLFESLGP